jgi:hypothetical protein
MITYNWNCRTVDCYPEQDNETNVVYNIHWRVIGISDIEAPEGYSPKRTTYYASIAGTQTVTLNSDSTFIPFQDLTNDIVVEWTKEAIGTEQVTALETDIENQISLQITPTSVTLTINDLLIKE